MRPALALLLLAATIGFASAQPAPNRSDEVLRQRILLKERFNKGWQIEAESPREMKARCRGEARKQFSALHPLKRRGYIKNCMAAKKP